MELKRIIFFDTRDGAVFASFVDAETAFSSYQNKIKNQYGTLENVDSIIIDVEWYAEKFDNKMFCRVLDQQLFFSNKDTIFNLGSKSTLNDRWFPLFENLYDLKSNNNELLKLFYDDYINYNLKAICEIVEPVWVDLDQLERFEDRNKLPLFDNTIFPPIEEFAEDIKNNGFIFPLHVTYRDGKYKIYDGGHRFYGCHFLKENKQWDDRKILCLNLKAINIKMISDPKVNHLLQFDLTMHLPTLLLNKYNFINFLSVKKFNEYISEVTVNKYLDAVLLTRMYILELTRACGSLKFDQSKIINNQLLFEEWRIK